MIDTEKIKIEAFKKEYESIMKALKNNEYNDVYFDDGISVVGVFPWMSLHVGRTYICLKYFSSTNRCNYEDSYLQIGNLKIVWYDVKGNLFHSSPIKKEWCSIFQYIYDNILEKEYKKLSEVM